MRSDIFGKTIRHGFLILGLSVTQFPLAAPSHAADETFIDGLAAFDGGEVMETVRIWRALAEQGDAQAQAGLAGLYLAGNGVDRDPKEAARLYRLAAEQGDSNGQLNLGRLYMNGIGVDKDHVNAYVWLTLAADQGRRWADERRRLIEPSLSDKQREDAQALITGIKARSP